jgi:predicted ATPase/class 3 adenylate cyclase
MRELPAGTVTFLFTDVEGSTRLLHELGDGYAEVLAEHRRVLRDAFARHGGVEVDTQGDAFFVAFGKASEALAAASEARSVLEEGPIRVRMGVHTGEPLVTDEGYVGIDVHRAARIAAAGHGGQILVSQSTRDLVGAESVRDLGEHRLKDLTAPERIYQLGKGDFPPLKSLNATNLPVASNPLVGREHELRELQGLLRDSVRLVTLTGAGGSGKTRLSLQVAAELLEDFPGGVFFVPLAGVRQPDLVQSTIAATVGVHDTTELRDRKALLVVDNFEHLLDAAPTVSALLASAQDARVLVTSRAPLRVEGEHEYPIEPLPDVDALDLLTQRARAVRPDFQPDETALEICRRLDGLPLALELAASRLRSLGSRALLDRLEHRMSILTGGRRDVPERQRTLRATIEWSYDLLSGELQRLFPRLAVFATFSADAAEAVAGATVDDLDGLVEASLLKPVREDRFLMLETIREFAAEGLQSQEAAELQRTHAEYYASLAVTLRSSALRGPALAQGQMFEAEQDNLRAALEHFLEFGPNETALELVDVLWLHWMSRGQLEEGQRWTERALEKAAPEPTQALSEVVGALGDFLRFRGELHQALSVKERALALARELDHASGIAATLHDLAGVLAQLGEFDRARRLAEEGLALRRELGDPTGIAHGLDGLGDVALFEGDYDSASRIYAEIAEIYATHDANSTQHAIGLFGWGDCLRRCGRQDEARERLRQALSLARELKLRQHVNGMLYAAAELSLSRSPERAAILIGAAEAVTAESGFGLFDPAECERIGVAVRGRLGDARYETAHAEGAALSADDGISLGLESLG